MNWSDINWSNTFFLTLALLACGVVMARIERSRWFMGLFFFVIPVLLLAVVWAALTASWPEALLALGAGALLGGGGWLALGRRIRRADSSGIKVWGQAAAPRPSKAALEAEVDQLRQEKDQLEAELRRLRDATRKGETSNGGRPPGSEPQS
jgi:hypothetical protein